MTYTEQAIRIACEHNWKPKGNEMIDYDFEGKFTRTNISSLLLDPLFFQALGRGLGWHEQRQCYYWDSDDDGDGMIGGIYYFPWQYNWHRLLDHLAEGKTIEDYFKELLTK